jgi:AraC-like DNA-binding protein
MTRDVHDQPSGIRERIKEKLLAWMPRPGDYQTAIDGVGIYRRDVPNQSEHCFYKPMILVVVQGNKRSLMGTDEVRYGEEHFLITGVDMPSASYLPDASSRKPFLSISLDLDIGLLTQLAAEMPPNGKIGNGSYYGVLIADLQPDMLNAFMRLVELIDKPDQIPFLAPMIEREIHYRLLMGPQGDRLRAMHTLGSQGNRVARAITWLRKNYKNSLQIDDLAAMVNMAISTFHRHFKDTTTLSPLQFQKRLRLYEAQRLMLAENKDATNACLLVGYESPSQFNREYKRMFGEPPKRDVLRKRRP